MTATVSETHVCIRTPQVRDAIVAAVWGKSACADITTTDLARITTLSVAGDPTRTSLKSGDFAGLTNLTTLGLLFNGLSSLPARVFDPLTKLTTLMLTGNRLSTLPVGVFDNLTELTTLFLDNNGLSRLPAGVFDNLTRLTVLNLGNNRLVSLPAGVFDNLPAGITLELIGNESMTCLPAIPPRAKWSCPHCLVPNSETPNYAVCGAATIGTGPEEETEEEDTETETETETETDGCDCVPSLGLTLRSVTLDEGSMAQYAVSLTQAPSDDVTVTLSGSDDGAVTVSPLVLTFTPSNWSTAQTVTLNAVQDPDTIDETVTLTHTTSGGGYDGVGADFTAMATVTDDDVPALILSPTSATLYRGRRGGCLHGGTGNAAHGGRDGDGE